MKPDLKTTSKHGMNWCYVSSILIGLSICIICYFVNRYVRFNINGRAWYKIPLFEFTHLLNIVFIFLLIAVVVNKIKYVGSALVSLAVTIALLVFIETIYCGMYEWQQRPENKEQLAKQKDIENKKRSNKSKPLTLSANSAFGKSNTPTIQTLDEIDFSKKDTNQSMWSKQDPKVSDYQVENTQMGFVNRPNVNLEVKSWSYGLKNPKAFYTTDSLGRRITELNTEKSPEKKYALFLGCSITFGLFVNNNQTLPAFFEGMDTNYVAYNYGVAGYGSHHLLALFENRNLRKEIPQKDGIAIYSYFIGHTQRAIGDMESYLSWNSSSPFYYATGNTVERNKDFKNGRKLTSWFYENISKTYFCRYYNLSFPGKLKSYHYELTAKIIEKAYFKYKEQFNNDNFYVVLLPGWYDEMKPYLDALHLKTIDCKNIVDDYWNEKYHFYGDGHPRPLFFKIVAQRVHEIVGEGKK